MKYCKKCDSTKEFNLFCKDKKNKDGLAFYCNECKRYLAGKSRIINRDILVDKSRHYRQDNLELIREKDRIRNSTPERRAYRNARNRYYLTKERSLNKIFMNEINEIYEKAILLTETTGIKHEVDHIIPIKGKTVSGLHVPWNLQILTQFNNRSKGANLTQTKDL